MLQRIADALGIDVDDVQLIVSMIKTSPKNRGNHATCMAQACSPMRDGQLGRAGLVLWRTGLVEHLGTEGMPLLLKLKDVIDRSAEQKLAAEILQTWEEYA